LRRCRHEGDAFDYRAPQLLNVRVECDQCETDHNPDQKPADVFRRFRIRIHIELFDVDLRCANLLQAIATTRSRPLRAGSSARKGLFRRLELPHRKNKSARRLRW